MNGFSTDWDTWPHLGPADIADLFNYNFDVGNL